MAGGPTRQDTFAVTVFVQNLIAPGRPMQNLGIWDKKSGGEVDSEEYKYSPGGMAATVSLGGRKNIGNVTVSRLYRLMRDHTSEHQMLITGVGKAAMVVSQQPLDIDGNVFGPPLVIRGTLKRVTPPEHDSESSDPAMVELEMTPEGEPVVG